MLSSDEVLFVSCSGTGAQGNHISYLVTRAGGVYAFDLYDPICSSAWLEQLCPFLIDWDFYTFPDMENLFLPETHYAFKRTDWCWIGLWGAVNLFIHASMAEPFARETRGFDSNDMHDKWLDVAVEIVRGSYN